MQVSNNGSTWTQVASGVGTFKATNITFAPVSAQYMRVNQTGAAAQWWSIGEMGVALNSDDYSWGSADAQTWTENIWKAIATRYKNNPAVAAYDLINEPLMDFNEDADDVAQKSAVYNQLYSAVRAIDPDHIIMMGAFFGYQNIARPSTYGWTNVMYQLHP